MADSDRVGSRSVRMTSDEIVQRGFASKVRGLSENDVRSFLRRVGEEVDRLGKREDELLNRVSDLQSELTSRPKATKAELLESLGEQTTRVLSSAEEAAEQMIADAKAVAEKTRSEAKAESEQLLETSRKQAEQAIVDAQDRVRSLQESSKRDSETVIAEARTQGREIFQESVVVREQILKDLLRRRDLLLEQIEELRRGREELLESYKVVKGSFQKATDALHSVEEKASSELLTNPVDVDALLKSPVELPSILNAGQPIPSRTETQNDELISNQAAAEPEKVDIQVEFEKEIPGNSSVEVIGTMPVSTGTGQLNDSLDEEEISITGKRKTLKKYVKEALGVGEEGETSTSSVAVIAPVLKEADQKESGTKQQAEKVESAPSAKKKDVGALFQSLKVQNETEIDKDDKIVDLTKSEDAEPVESSTSSPAGKLPKKKSIAKKDPLAIRDEALAGVTTTILRKAKRQLQDEQNELLEALRTIKPKKRVAAEDILASETSQIKSWEEAIRTDLENVFAQGAKTVSKEKFQYPDEAMKSAVSWIVSPLRETLMRAINEGEQADATARVGARYREWRNSDLKSALYDALCSAFNNGVLKAAKNDATISWNVEKAGQCPDCDDNALEPTAVGESFPTGQVAPPAHSGCRCVIVVA